MPPSRKSKSRRTHTLGGCQTCRRRHVKCDQMRPTCLTCRAFGVSCEGYSTEIRWMSGKHQSQQQRQSSSESRSADKSATSSGGHGTRRHLYTGEIIYPTFIVNNARVLICLFRKIEGFHEHGVGRGPCFRYR